jgi:hypothetical protein
VETEEEALERAEHRHDSNERYSSTPKGRLADRRRSANRVEMRHDSLKTIELTFSDDDEETQNPQMKKEFHGKMFKFAMNRCAHCRTRWPEKRKWNKNDQCGCVQSAVAKFALK